MKPSSLLGLLCLVFCFCACEKDKAVSASGLMTFTVDSVAFKANDARGSVMDDSTGVGKKTLTISGIAGGGLNKLITVSVIFPDTLVAGEFTAETHAGIFWAETMSDTIPVFLSKKATVKITSINSKYAEGTFAGILNNGEIEKPLTDGIFKVNIY